MKIAVIIPVFNASRLLAETLQSVGEGTRLPDELIVVDDGSTDDSAAVAEKAGARVLRMPAQSGPAVCRNRAATLSHSDVLIFLDADTCVHRDTLSRLEAHLAEDPDLSAVIGSYDDRPRDPGLCSRFRNLAHSYVHHSANRHALTFWSGCGAVRTSVFMQSGGFDECFSRPSIEDIELGYRMSDNGARILLDPQIMVTHTKRWTVRNSMITDVRDRGLPWMLLLLERGHMPDDLNLRLHHRVGVILTLASVVAVGWAAASRSAVWGGIALCLALLAVATDYGLLRFLTARGGTKLAVAGAGLLYLQNLCKFVATAGALIRFVFRPHSVERRLIKSAAATRPLRSTERSAK